MADDVTPHDTDTDLPTPDGSPFFAPESEPDAQPPAESPATQPEPSAPVDLGSTEPHTPLADELADAQVAQPTELLAPVSADQAAAYDSQVAQPTQALPIVPPEAPVILASTMTVTAGSRVVIVVSRGVSEVPPTALVGVPHVVGMSQGEALSQLQQAGLSAQVFNEYADQPRGEVIGQLPPFAASAPAGSEAVLLVSGGPAPASTLSVPLPDVVGLSEADALARLQAAGLSPQIVRDFNPNVPLGVVIAQLPNGQSVAEVPRKKASLWWLWLLLAFAVLFAASGGAYYFFNRTAAVPNLVGLTQSQAEKAVEAAGFKMGSLSTTQTLNASDVGKVVSQSPPPNTQLKLIDQVSIMVSGGQRLFAVPDVTGKTQAVATSELASAGLQVSVNQAYSQTVAKDMVISQTPVVGQKVPYQTTVGLTVSLGVQSVVTPGVQLLTRADAANRLKAANLSSQAVVEYTFTGTAKGLVFAQYPTAGMQVPPGTIVGLLVSNGPPASTSATSSPSASQLANVPSVVGQTLKTAQKTLKTAHLGNTIINWSGTGRPAGEVVGQAPEVNQTMPRNVAVIVFVSNGK